MRNIPVSLFADILAAYGAKRFVVDVEGKVSVDCLSFQIPIDAVASFDTSESQPIIGLAVAAPVDTLPVDGA